MTYLYSWATADDPAAVDRVVALVDEVSRVDPFVGLPPDAGSGDLDRLRDRLLAGLRAGSSHVLVITAPDAAGGEAVGCVVLTQAATANQRHIGELTTGAVRPEHRGRHLVSRAFAETVRRCEELGVELLRLDVREGIRAEKLWRFYGFEQYGRLDDYGRVGDQQYAGIYLAQPVSQLKARVFTKEAAHAE
jgi:ribosomal protein S18 acetylase RimI-like enzyme